VTTTNVPNLTCSAASAVDEPLPGTAAHATAWLCVEQPGPWGRDMIGDAVLGVELSAELGRRTAAANVRPMLVRRSGRTVATGQRTVLLASSVPGNTWCERLVIGALDELLDIDLDRLAGPPPGIGDRVTEPTVLVCAHSKRDQCCARFGRPVAAHLAATYGDMVWECSHTGGHRFAPSMIMLPTGYTYGRLDAEQSEAVVEAVVAGSVPVTGLRGRSSYTAYAQAAEVAVRSTIHASVDALTVVEFQSDPVVVHADGRRWEAHVRTRPLPPRPASCGAVPKPAEAVEVVRLRELGVQRTEG